MNPLILRSLVAVVALGILGVVGWVFWQPAVSSAPVPKASESPVISGNATIKSSSLARQPSQAPNEQRPMRNEEATVLKENGGGPWQSTPEQAAEFELAPGTRAPAVFLHENREALTILQNQALDEIANEFIDAVQRTPDEQVDEVFDRSVERADSHYTRIFGESDSMQHGMEAAIEAMSSEATPEAGR